jgi:hypothetical protein
MNSEKKTLLQQAILLIREGNWDKAHDLVQQFEGDYDFDAIHALLHRQEGDTFNARWWYRRLGKDLPVISIDEELNKLDELYR